MTGYTSISVATLVCAWVSTCLVSVAVFIGILDEIRKRRAVLEKKEETWRLRPCKVYTWCAFVIALAMVGQTTWAVVDEGQGEHFDRESRSQFELAAKSLFVNECLWTLVNTLARLAAFDFLKTVFGSVSVFRRRMYVILGILVAVHGAGTVLAGLLVCKPLNAAWDLNSSGSCTKETEAFVACEAFGLAFDLSIVVTPLPIISKLTMRMRKKLKVGLAFSVGSLVIIVTGLRLAALWRVNSTDITYDKGYLGLLSVVGSLAGLFLGDTESIARVANLFSKQAREHNEPQAPRKDPEPESLRYTTGGREFMPLDSIRGVYPYDVPPKPRFVAALKAPKELPRCVIRDRKFVRLDSIHDSILPGDIVITLETAQGQADRTTPNESFQREGSNHTTRPEDGVGYVGGVDGDAV